MENNKTFKGKWFLPGKNNSVVGELLYSEESGVILKVDSLFPGVLHYLNVKFDVILGITSSGERITLLDSWHYSLRPQMEYRSSYLIVGYHLTEPQEQIFSELSFSCDFLNEWTGFNSIKKLDLDDGYGEIKFEMPPSYTFKIDDNVRGELISKIRINRSQKDTDISIERNTSVKLHFPDKRNFRYCLEQYTKFYKFLTFSFQAAPNTYEISLFFGSSSANVYFKTRSYNKEEKSCYFLYELREISDFEGLISRWYHLEEKIDASISLLFDTYLNGFSFNENAFLNQCQALEVFHRRLYTINEEELLIHKEKLSEIIASVDIKHRNWLKEKLCFSHEQTLKSRLTELLSKVIELEPIKKMAIDSNLLKRVVDNRNYFTHYGSLPRKGIFEGEDLLKVTLKLKILHIIILLKELGFQDDEIINIYNSGRFTHIAFAFT